MLTVHVTTALAADKDAPAYRLPERQLHEAIWRLRLTMTKHKFYLKLQRHRYLTDCNWGAFFKKVLIHRFGRK